MRPLKLTSQRPSSHSTSRSRASVTPAWFRAMDRAFSALMRSELVVLSDFCSAGLVSAGTVSAGLVSVGLVGSGAFSVCRMVPSGAMR